MESKKNDKVKIENYSKLFFQLGLALTMLVVYLALEHKAIERNIKELAYIQNQNELIEDIPITERLEIQKPPPPPPIAPETIEIVEDKTEVEETIFESTEIDQTDAVEIMEISEIDEVVEEEAVVEDVPFAIIEEAPIFPGCKGNKAERKKCLTDKIREHIGKKFDTSISEELGLEPGKKKIYVLFTINKQGNIANVRARGPHKRLESEAIDAVKSLPKMTPARQRDRPVGIKYTLPITLDVQH